MDALFHQLLGPNSSIIGRVIALAVIAAVAVFGYMARAAVHEGENNAREDREAARRAEALVAQVRRELAEKRD